MPHGRFDNPVVATMSGIADLFRKQKLADRLSEQDRIEGKTCIVTGANSGLGLAYATNLNMKRIFTYFLTFILFLLFTACSNSASEVPLNTASKEPSVIGVSVWDRISSRSEPRRASASTTLLSLGESFLYLDSSAIDSAYNNTEFLKARLSDSSIVWVYGFASVLNAKPGVITKNVPLYLRPDLLTITDSELEAMEIVAVTEEWDNWIRVVNEKKENVGWIKNDFITYNTIDLAFALLAKRKLDKDDREEKIDAIEDLLSNNPYPNTIFIPEISERLDAEKELLREMRENRDRDRDDQDRRRRNN